MPSERYLAKLEAQRRYNRSPGRRAYERSRPRWTRKIEMRYNIDFVQYDELLREQVGLCAICTKQLIGVNEPHLDHCHDTGIVRGLLCRFCNISLGQLGDNVEAIRRVLAYLEGWR